MDSAKSYINREPSTLVDRQSGVRLDRDWIIDWQVSLAYATTFLCILLLQYILKLTPGSELSFRGHKLSPHQLYCIKYSYQLDIINKQIDLTYTQDLNTYTHFSCE